MGNVPAAKRFRQLAVSGNSIHRRGLQSRDDSVLRPLFDWKVAPAVFFLHRAGSRA
jgi:hypothetical protein